MEAREYKGNRILVYLCIAHHILKCFHSYDLLLLGFQKYICQLQCFSLKWEGNIWVQKQKAQNGRVLVPIPRRRWGGVGTCLFLPHDQSFER